MYFESGTLPTPYIGIHTAIQSWIANNLGWLKANWLLQQHSYKLFLL